MLGQFFGTRCVGVYGITIVIPYTPAPFCVSADLNLNPNALDRKPDRTVDVRQKFGKCFCDAISGKFVLSYTSHFVLKVEM